MSPQVPDSIVPPTLPTPDHALALGVGIVALIGTVVSGLWKVLARPFVWAYDALWFGAVERNEDRVKARWGKVFVVEMAANETARDIALTTQRDVALLRDSMTAIGRSTEGIPELARSVSLVAQELRNNTEVLRDVVKDQREHGEFIGRIDERGQGIETRLDDAIRRWDGHERRIVDSEPRQHERRVTRARPKP